MWKYIIGVDPKRGDPHYDKACRSITIMLSDDATGELGEIVKLLDAGQYQIEGGYPCGGGRCRHPAQSVRLLSAERPEGKFLWARFPG